MASSRTVWDRLARVLDTYDADFEVSTASAAAWAGHLRLTLTDPEAAPSRSMTFYSAGGASPEAVARAVLDDAERWMRETGTTPLPVPEWMLDAEGPPSEPGPAVEPPHVLRIVEDAHNADWIKDAGRRRRRESEPPEGDPPPTSGGQR